MVVIESFSEMGAPYPVERGGAPRILSAPVSDRTLRPDDHRVVHPEWPPQAPRVLSPRTEKLARDLDRMLDNYLRPNV